MPGAKKSIWDLRLFIRAIFRFIGDKISYKTDRREDEDKKFIDQSLFFRGLHGAQPAIFRG